MDCLDFNNVSSVRSVHLELEHGMVCMLYSERKCHDEVMKAEKPQSTLEKKGYKKNWAGEWDGKARSAWCIAEKVAGEVAAMAGFEGE